MSVAVDTNVLVRYLTWDDQVQAEAAAAVIEGGEPIVVPTIVLCEVAWVLRRAYRFGTDEIGLALRQIITSRDVQVDRPAAEAGLAMLAQGGDFADGVVLAEAGRANCTSVVTFDRAFARLAPTATVTLL